MSEQYRIDKNEIALQREKNASIIISKAIDIEAKTPISFIKSTIDFKKIREDKTETFQLALWLIFVRIAGLLGIKTQIDDFTKYDIVNMIYKVHSDLSLQEIWKAFELERYGEFEAKTDHFQFFSAEYVGAILKKYKSWKQMIKTQHNFNLHKIEEKNQMSDKEKKEIVNQGIINKFIEFKESKQIEPPFVHLFDELFERGILKNPTPETPKILYYYQEKLKQAEEEIKSEMQTEKALQNISTNQYKEELIKIAEKHSEKSQIRAKRIVLQEFFEKHIENNTDFESLIKNS